MANNSGNYSSAQIMAMQKDAERRVMEMRRMANERIRRTEKSMRDGSSALSDMPSQVSAPAEGNGGFVQRQPHSNANQPSTIQKKSANAANSSEAVQLPCAPNGLQGILDRLGLDEESLLILLLLLILINEGADTMLILALVYLLL